MIREVSIQNFKSLRDVRVKLERFTVFVGANASGKSSILQAINAACRNLMNGPGQRALNDLEVVHGLSKGAALPVTLEAEFGGRWYRYHTNYVDLPRQSLADAAVLASSGKQPKGWQPWGYLKNHSAKYPKSTFIRLEASKLIQPSSVDNDPFNMAPDGTGMHAALTSMVLYEPDTWQVLQADLKTIIPSIRRLRHSKIRPGQVPSLLFDTVGADSLEAHEVSEGTLFVLGLLTILHSPDRPNLILLDDLDRGLHPKAQRELVGMLRGFLKTSPDLQIVATTHSPYLLDCMEPNEVRMTCLQADGSTVCDSIEKHPEFPKWKDDMYPGELWSLFGERWILKEEATV